MTAWYEKWFNDLYPKIYPHRNLKEAELQVEAVIKMISLRDSCLDIACGTGRHVKFLSKYFKSTVGIDLSAELIKIGKEQGNFKDAKVFQADMRNPPFDLQSFDLVTNFFTGFGYFDTDLEHQNLISTWSKLLTKDGLLIIDYLNRAKVIKDLIPQTIREIEGYKVIETRKLSEDGLRIEKLIEINKDIFAKTFNESVRMYNPEKLIEMLRNCKLTIIGAYGNFCWDQYNQESERLIVIAKNDKSI